MNSMSNFNFQIRDRIIHHYNLNSNFKKYANIVTNDRYDFEPISYIASLKLTELPRDEMPIDDLASHIGRELVGQEFHHFAVSLNQITDNTTETTLENLPITFEQVYNDLWDEGYEKDLFFVPFSLNREIRRQKNITSVNATGLLANPVHIREIGQNQIFLASKNNFVKIYPETYDKIDVFVNRMYHHANHAEINCAINQKLEIVNRPTIARILVTDVDNT